MPKHRALRLLPDGEVALVERGMSPAPGSDVVGLWACGQAVTMPRSPRSTSISVRHRHAGSVRGCTHAM
jgi:hypothetical protein